MGDESIRNIAEKALEESINAIIKYYNADESQLKDYASDLLKRYSNKYLKDTVIRVGRDPKRKLQPEDRLTGAALFCISQGITPEYILYGIAAAFCFDVLEDVSSLEIIKFVKRRFQ